MKRNNIIRRFACLPLIVSLLFFAFGAVPVYAAGTTEVIFTDSSVKAGDEVLIPVTIRNNPGIASFRFRVTFDSDVFTSASATAGSLLTVGTLSYEVGNTGNTLTFQWYSTENVSGDGEIAILKFRASETLQGNYSFSVKYLDNDIVNEKLETITYSATKEFSVAITCPHRNTKTHEAKAATCSQQGHNAYTKCMDCGVITEGSDELFYGDHLYGKLIEATSEKHTPTELIPAIDTHYICSECNKYFNEQKAETTLEKLTGKAPTHQYNEWTDAGEQHWQECDCGHIANTDDHTYDDDLDEVCNVCGHERQVYTPGDIDGVEGINDRDAIYLLMNSFFEEDYPLNQSGDFDGNGEVNDRDAIYLLMYSFFPDDYPLMNR